MQVCRHPLRKSLACPRQPSMLVPLQLLRMVPAAQKHLASAPKLTMLQKRSRLRVDLTHRVMLRRLLGALEMTMCREAVASLRQVVLPRHRLAA